MRNHFVHNDRSVSIVPTHERETTLVEIKKLDHDSTAERFYLEPFTGWVLGHYLLFAIAIARGTRGEL